MTFNFVPPGNPLSYWDRPFRNRRTQRTHYGVVCYFCRVVVDIESTSPCCPAASEWAEYEAARSANRLWSLIGRQVKE